MPLYHYSYTESAKSLSKLPSKSYIIRLKCHIAGQVYLILENDKGLKVDNYNDKYYI